MWANYLIVLIVVIMDFLISKLFSVPDLPFSETIWHGTRLTRGNVFDDLKVLTSYFSHILNFVIIQTGPFVFGLHF